MRINIFNHLDGKILFGSGSRNSILDLIKEINPFKIGVVTDIKVSKIHRKYLEQLVSDANIDLVIKIMPGDKSKSLDTASYIWKKLMDNDFTRKSMLISFGGGVIGDITGFVASTYMRGITWINIPTTLLAQADSALGGKTGINFNGKNIIGTFYIPLYTIIDPYFLHTLSKDELKNGMAEIIKHSLIKGGPLYNLIQKNDINSVINSNKVLEKMIELSIQAKLSIITTDFREKGLRRVLNFGHTVGHAVEALTKYSIPHGYAVSIGLATESYVSYKLFQFQSYSKVINLLKSYGLPTDLIGDPHDLLNYMRKDKKNWMGKITFVLLREIGDTIISELEEKVIMKYLGELT